MGMRSARALAVGRRDRLINLDAAKTADEDAMRIGRQDHFHCFAAGTEYGFSGAAPQRRDDIRIAAADMEISLQGPKPEIEQDAGAIFFTESLAVGADFGELRASAHRAARFRQAERDAMAPAFGGGGFRRNRAEIRMRRDAQGSLGGDRRDAAVGSVKHHRFVGVARKFSESAERAEAPCDLVVGGLFGKKIQKIGHHITLWLRGVGLGGGPFPWRT